MPKFRNISGDALDCFKPAEVRGSEHVDNLGEVEVDGEVQEIGDAYIVGEGDNARAWPKALWQLVVDKKPATVKES